jgi:alkylated DNA repair dioxygenase AlkB
VARQQELFSDVKKRVGSSLPEGFRYQTDFIDHQHEVRLVEQLQTLDLKPFEFHGHLGNRRVISFGLRYNYDQREVQAAPDMPSFLDELRDKAAQFAGHSPQDIKQVGINEYWQDAGIGWHRDKPEFGDVIGVSLLAPVRLRLRLRQGQKWERRSIDIEPRSIYLLSGPVRTQWEHSIPPVAELRYSIMFRTLAVKSSASTAQVKDPRKPR